jgi:glycosyltransferase involved in cell wall biosynthesis
MKVLFAESHNLDRPDPLGSHHYIRQFQKSGHECFWLGPAVSPLHVFKADRLNRHRFRVWKEGVRDVQGIKWKVPFTLAFYYNLPLLKSLVVGRNQYRFCLPSLRKSLATEGFSPVDLLWCAGPVAYSLLDLVPHKISCYRLADRIDQFSRVPSSALALQKELIRRVDFVLATSQSLYEWAAAVRSHDLYYLPNGVSELFFQSNLSRPRDFPDTTLPVAIYLGTLDSRFDIETVEDAVLRQRDLYFLLIGPLTDQRLKPFIERLQAEPNFSWLGPKKQEEAPAYLQQSSIGLIPFYLNELTEAVNPIKYYEYLASGLPVVAPILRELSMINGPVCTYDHDVTFICALKQALKEREAGPESLQSFAAGQTWLERFKKVSTIVDQCQQQVKLAATITPGLWLSIVVIGRNEAENLPALFVSLPQGEDIEWLYIDSGSDDNSAAIAADAGAKVFVLEEDSVYGPGTGRYVGTKKAGGRWVLYLDGDMRLRAEFKNFLLRLKDEEKLVPAGVAGFVGRTINCYTDADGKVGKKRDYIVLPKSEMGDPENWGKPATYHGGAVLYLKKAVLEAGNWNPALYQLEELDLVSRVIDNGHRMQAIDLPLADHLTESLSLKERLLLNFLPSWQGKKLFGAGQLVAARLREGGLLPLVRCYPYPFLVLGGLILAPFLYLVWPPLPLVVNLAIAFWIGCKKRWYFYLVYLGNLFQMIWGIRRYHPFKPGFNQYPDGSHTV